MICVPMDEKEDGGRQRRTRGGIEIMKFSPIPPPPPASPGRTIGHLGSRKFSSVFFCSSSRLILLIVQRNGFRMHSNGGRETASSIRILNKKKSCTG